MISTTLIAWLNEIGGRQQLEDSIYPRPGSTMAGDRLFMVCDGIGGEKAGEVASQIVSDEFARYFSAHPPQAIPVNVQYLEQACGNAIEKLRGYVTLNPDAVRMGTTIALAYLNDQHIDLAWCGDSRIYHIRDGRILWRTTDHSVVGDLIRDGKLSEAQARHHPHKNILMRAITPSGSACDIDLYNLTDIQPADYLLLCTDGLLESIDDQALETIFSQSGDDKELVFRQYCEGQVSDNFSMYLLQIGGKTVINV